MRMGHPIKTKLLKKSNIRTFCLENKRFYSIFWFRPTSYTTSVSWNKNGDRIYAGTSKGFLNVIDVESRKVCVVNVINHLETLITISKPIFFLLLQLAHSMRITSTSIKGLQVSRKGRDIVVNANDRIIRVYNISGSTSIPKLQNKFQDLVNRIQWNQVCFSTDGEFIIGGKEM
jgi:COMPASS component SWD1